MSYHTYGANAKVAASIYKLRLLLFFPEQRISKSFSFSSFTEAEKNLQKFWGSNTATSLFCYVWMETDGESESYAILCTILIIPWVTKKRAGKSSVQP